MKAKLHNHSRQYDYDFHVSNRGIIGIYGVSGSGKSSLLDAIAGYDNNVKGTIKFNNNELIGIHQCAYMNQNPILFQHWTVKENLEFVKEYHNNSYQELIKKLKCENLLNKYPQQLSGGEKQRITLIRTLIQIKNGQLVLLDEPFTAMDPYMRNVALNLIKEQTDCLIFLISHDIKELYNIADELLYIKEGIIDYHGSIENTMSAGINGLPIASKVTIDDEKHVIYADDVSLSLEKQSNSSIQHQLNCKISAIEIIGIITSIELIENTNNQKLYAKITTDSHNRLNLSIDMNIFANFKALSYQ